MAFTKVAAFVRQPSTVLGLSALVGTFTAVLTGQIGWQGAIPAVAGALAAIALPDNTHAQATIRNAAAAAVTAEEAVIETAPKPSGAPDMVKSGLAAGVAIAAITSLGACAVPPATVPLSAGVAQVAAAPGCNIVLPGGPAMQEAATAFEMIAACSVARAVP